MCDRVSCHLPHAPGLTARKAPDPPSRYTANSSTVPSLHTIIVSFLSAVQAISSTALSIINIYKRTVHTIKKVHNSPPPHTSPPQSPTRPSPDASAETTPAPSPPTPEAPSTPSVPSPSQSVAASVDSQPNVGTPPPTPPLLPTRAPPHNLTRPSLLLFAELFSLPTRFAGMALLFICDALATAFSSFLDRYAALLPPSPSFSHSVYKPMSQPPSALPLHLYSYARPNYSARDCRETLTLSQWLPGTDTPGSDARRTSRVALRTSAASRPGDTWCVCHRPLSFLRPPNECWRLNFKCLRDSQDRWCRCC